MYFESEYFCHKSLQDGEERKGREDLGSILMEEKERWTRRVWDKMGSVSGAHWGRSMFPGLGSGPAARGGSWGR